MANYDYRKYDSQAWLSRYPIGTAGRGEWLAQRSGLEWQGIGKIATGRPAPAKGAVSRPRIFVSHRRIDIAKAERIAWLADQEGFELWLDAFDPSLQQLQKQLGTGSVSANKAALATAAIIEMALLNSSHVVATMTLNVKGSLWVPYEYGRAKEVGPITVQAGCWVEANLRRAGALPEYLHLGKKTFSESDIRTWLSSEFQHWRRKYSSPATAPAWNWHGPVPAAL